MRFVPTAIPELYIVELEPRLDERGFFARAWCESEFAARGLDGSCRQCNFSYNRHRGTLRGLHYQVAPSEEVKIVRVVRGAVHDVVLDLRSSSPTLHQWCSVELTADNRRSLYVPAGCAHGFLTLSDDSELFYLMSASFDSGLARGVRWNDPLLAGAWPFEPSVISRRDREFTDISRPWADEDV